MEFSRQEYWSGLPFLPLGDLLNLEIQPESPALAGRFFTTDPPGKPVIKHKQVKLLNVHFCTVEAVLRMFCISMNF